MKKPFEKTLSSYRDVILRGLGFTVNAKRQTAKAGAVYIGTIQRLYMKWGLGVSPKKQGHYTGYMFGGILIANLGRWRVLSSGRGDYYSSCRWECLRSRLAPV